MAVLSMLGGWFLVMGGVGGIEENWFWPVLAAFPTFYFLGFSVLAALGRLRLGGVWLASSRVVDEHWGVRSELALVDVTAVTRVPTASTSPRPGPPRRRRPSGADVPASCDPSGADAGPEAAGCVGNRRR